MMFGEPWINWIHPDLKNHVLLMIEHGASVEYSGGMDGGMVVIRLGSSTIRGYDAKTGELKMRN